MFYCNTPNFGLNASGEDGGETGQGTKLQRGGEVRREWNGEAVLAFRLLSSKLRH